ncbi:ABC transporter ATP-binding protein YtrB [Variovorax sp. SRS16]|uniref:ABC transporter ATP-binding protein n=1 Tax=Variovorax sp. SRS16 TaxID=282217 RepID=UPI00131768BE|nr:ATP-binding cassette domain-containing protein [Variovorax sp. SRS16]VTU15301.1 ABC transporter ATP-binding protein YtrB [Variovorax sp. SRS16]
MDNSPHRPRILHIENLRFAHPDQPALASGWTGSIEAGVTLLYGDTGSGKSTLLRVMAGLLPGGGRLTLGGVHLDEDPEAYRRDLFFCDPTADQFDRMTARECTASLRADDPRFDAAGWQALVDGFALTPHLDKQMFMLSTGSKRKVGLAAALASGRALTLLDEPAAALDGASIRCLRNALADAARRSERAIVVASSERLDGLALAASIDVPMC